MKTVATLVMALLCTSLIQGQNSISGKIVNEQGEAISFATVMLNRTADTTMVKAMISEEDGAFFFEAIPSDTYVVVISFVGYADLSSHEIVVGESAPQIVLEDLLLEEASEQLDEVVVRAVRPLIELEPDKTVFNVEGSVNAAGSDALELLRKAPGVMVDNNDQIIVQGKSGVQIYIDGKPSPLGSEDLAMYLRTLQSSDIDAIEIITNPSAKYDAEGNAGIINIRLVKDKSLGTNGSITLGARHGLQTQLNGSLSLNHRSKKVNVFGTYNNFDGTWENHNYFVRKQSGSFFDQSTINLHDNVSHNMRLGVDFYVSDKSTIGFLAKGGISNYDNNSDSRAEIGSLSDNIVTSILKAGNQGIGDRDNFNLNLNYVYRPEENQKLNIDLDYGRFRNDEDSKQPNTYWNPGETSVQSAKIYQTISPTDIDIYTAKIDYETSFLKGQLGLGAKASYVTTNNIFDFFNLVDGEQISDLERSNDFVYDERVGALYANWQKSINEQWSFQAGLRMEHTRSNGDLTSIQDVDDKIVAREYTDFFPSAGLSFQANDKNTLRLNYSRRIDRPNYQNLNPFEDKLDELTFQKGNPFLSPQYSTSFSLAHTYQHRLTTTLSYAVTNDVFTPVTDAFDERSAFLTTINLAEQKNLSLSVAYPFSPAEWWSVYATMTGFRQTSYSEYQDKTIDLKANVFNSYMQNTFALPHAFKLELSGWYNSPGIWGNWTAESQFDVSVGVQKKILEEKGSIKVSFSDIFKRNRWKGESTFGDFYMNGGGRWDSRQIKVNFKYNFGGSQVKSARQRKTGLEEEAGRVGG